MPLRPWPFTDEVEMEVIKSVNEDKRLFTAAVLIPETVDAHGDIYSSEVVEEAAHDFMKYSQQSNLQHMFDVEKELVHVVENWITPSDITIGEKEVKKGSWIMTVKVEDDAI